MRRVLILVAILASAAAARGGPPVYGNTEGCARIPIGDAGWTADELRVTESTIEGYEFSCSLPRALGTASLMKVTCWEAGDDSLASPFFVSVRDNQDGTLTYADEGSDEVILHRCD